MVPREVGDEDEDMPPDVGDEDAPIDIPFENEDDGVHD